MGSDNQPRWVKRPDGKFAGSIGKGKTAPAGKPQRPSPRQPAQVATPQTSPPRNQPAHNPKRVTATRTPTVSTRLLFGILFNLLRRVRGDIWVASHPTTPPSRLRQLLTPQKPNQKPATQTPTDLTSAFRKHYTTNQPAVTAEAKPYDPDQWQVAERVGIHHNTPYDVLNTLAVDPDPRVRAGVARNPMCDRPLLLSFIHDPHPEVRRAAATNPTLGKEAVHKLLGDENVLVRRQAAAHETLTADDLAGVWFRETNPKVLESVAANPNIARNTWMRASTHDDVLVRSAAAGNRHAPPEQLTGLADIAEPTVVRAAAVSNPNCPRSVVSRWADADDGTVGVLCRRRLEVDASWGRWIDGDGDGLVGVGSSR